MIATENTLKPKPSSTLLFFIIMSPVGSYYAEGLNPISVWVPDTYTRTSVGGVGQAKTGGNYAASFRAQQEAQRAGFSQVLWLDPVERKYVEEVGTMNIFFVFSDRIVTPALSGTILPGLTRDTVLSLAKELNIPIEEGRISIQQVIEGIQNGTLREVFGTGTAVGIAPVGKIHHQGTTYTVGDNKTGTVTKQFFAELTNARYGIRPDIHHWLVTIPAQN